MILLSVPEAFAFDYLSILEVKRRHGLDVIDELAKQWNELRERCSIFAAVVRSEEYHRLSMANDNVWTLVGKAAFDEVSAKAVFEANLERFKAKTTLQNRFWPNVTIQEIKDALHKH